MFSLQTIIWFVIIIVCILFAFLAYKFLNYSGFTLSIPNGTKVGGFNSNIDNKELVEQIYNLLLEYVEDVGTSEYIEDYLMTIHDISVVEPSPYSTVSIKYPRLYNIISFICKKHTYKNKYEFVFFNGIKYMWFLPDNLRELLIGKAKLKFQTHDKFAIKNNLDQLIYPSTAHKDLIMSLAEKLLPLSRCYVKLKKTAIVKLGGVKKRKKPAKKASAKPKSAERQLTNNLPHITKEMLEPDIIGFNGVLNEIAEAIKLSIVKPEAVTAEQQLKNIDLMALRWTDPEAVKSFIMRIVPDIKRIIELDSSKYTSTVLRNLTTNLLRDITFEEAELARERNRLREELEREKEKVMFKQNELEEQKRIQQAQQQQIQAQQQQQFQAQQQQQIQAQQQQEELQRQKQQEELRRQQEELQKQQLPELLAPEDINPSIKNIRERGYINLPQGFL